MIPVRKLGCCSREEYSVDKNRTDIDCLKKIPQILSNNNEGT